MRPALSHCVDANRAISSRKERRLKRSSLKYIDERGIPVVNLARCCTQSWIFRRRHGYRFAEINTDGSQSARWRWTIVKSKVVFKGSFRNHLRSDKWLDPRSYLPHRRYRNNREFAFYSWKWWNWVSISGSTGISQYKSFYNTIRFVCCKYRILQIILDLITALSEDPKSVNPDNFDASAISNLLSLPTFDLPLSWLSEWPNIHDLLGESLKRFQIPWGRFCFWR